MHIASSLALILVLVATNAQAASPDSPERRSNAEASLAEWLNETNSTCTTDITARFDWSVAPDEDTSVYDCHTPVEAIRASCKDWPEKDAVKEQIRAVACVFGTAGGGGWGDPRRRYRRALAADIRSGYVSPEAARRDYGYAAE